jgi:hypothetical protein
MNKLYGDSSDGKVLALVLEPGNIQKLVHERKPIELKLHEGPWKNGIPPKVNVVIMYSETPVADAREIAKLIGPENFEDARTPVQQAKRPHCAECHSTVEQLGLWRSDQSPVWIVFCAMCGCVFGTTPPVKVEQP